MIVEACVENLVEALNAEKNGVTRIELCENLTANGTTPSYGMVETCCKLLNIPIFVMIRPRDSFIFSPQEIDVMLTNIANFKKLVINLPTSSQIAVTENNKSADDNNKHSIINYRQDNIKNSFVNRTNTGIAGFVLGVLNKDCKSINYPVMKELINACGNTNIIFHKAFDELKNPLAEVAKLKNIGITHILSSGKQVNALDAKEYLHKLYQECLQNSIQLTVAGKITKANLMEVKKLIPAHAYHGRNIVELS